MSNCSTLTCQMDGRIRPVAPAGAVISDSAVATPGNPTGPCSGRGRANNRSGRRTADADSFAPSFSAVPMAASVGVQATPLTALPTRPPPGVTTVLSRVEPPAQMPLPLATGIGYPAAPVFVGGVPVGAVETVPGFVAKAPTTMTGAAVPAAVDTTADGQPAPKAETPVAPPMLAPKDDAVTQLPTFVPPPRPYEPKPAAPLGPVAAALGGATPSLQLDPKELLAFRPQPTAPAGAVSMAPEHCYRAFFDMALLDQARVFEDGRLGGYQFAQAVAADLRRGLTASGRAGADWVFQVFPRGSAEQIDFCKAVSAASPSAPAGAVFADNLRANSATKTAYIAPKAAPGPAWQSAPYADGIHACIDHLRLVAPLTFGRALQGTSVVYHTPQGVDVNGTPIFTSQTFRLADDRYSINTARTLASPELPFGQGVQIRDQYIGALRGWLIAADAEPTSSRRRVLRDLIADFCARAGVAAPRVAAAGDPVDMDFSNDPTVPGSVPDPWAGLRGAGLGPAYDSTTGQQFDPRTGQPMQQGPSTGAQVVQGLGAVTQQGFGVLGTYLQGEAQRDAARITADAQRAVAQATSQAQVETARINMERELALARLNAEMRAAQQTGDPGAASLLQGQIASLQAQIQSAQQPQQPQQQQQNTGLSTGATVGLAVGGAALVGGVLFLATSGRKQNGARRARRRRMAA